MDSNQEKALQNLMVVLGELMQSYQSLADILGVEKQLLLAADIEKLAENNKTKEALLFKIRSIDNQREKAALELARLVSLNSKQPRLLELSSKLPTGSAETLRQTHASLEGLIRKIFDMNRENEEYAQSALRTLNGAMDQVKETLAGKKTYEKKGKMAYGPEQSGNFVSKEA